MDNEQFRDGMRRLTAGVNIITTIDGDGIRYGLTATAVCSLTTEPPALIACVNLNSSISRFIEHSAVFAVNVLTDTHCGLAETFAGRAGLAREDRFTVGSWMTSLTGVPLLSDAAASFECRLLEARPFGTHLILIGDVVKTHLGGSTDSPLLYGNGAFKGSRPLMTDLARDHQASRSATA